MKWLLFLSLSLSVGFLAACHDHVPYYYEDCYDVGYDVDGDGFIDYYNYECYGYYASTAQDLCGNGQIDKGEECDGNNLGEATCAALGFDGGDVTCADNCTLDTAACSYNDAGNNSSSVNN